MGHAISGTRQGDRDPARRLPARRSRPQPTQAGWSDSADARPYERWERDEQTGGQWGWLRAKPVEPSQRHQGQQRRDEPSVHQYSVALSHLSRGRIGHYVPEHGNQNAEDAGADVDLI